MMILDKPAADSFRQTESDGGVLFFSFPQSFIRACLAYRKEERIDVFGLARHEYLQPPMPKPRGAGAGAGGAGAGAGGATPAPPHAFSAAMFGAGSSS